VDWAFATRFQADRDLVVASGMRTLPLDPSLAGANTGSKAGFDLTLPPGERILEHRTPQPPKVDGRRLGSLQAALADGPKFFAELMAAAGSRDGREIVRELEGLRASGRLSRDNESRYHVTGGAGFSPPSCPSGSGAGRSHRSRHGRRSRSAGLCPSHRAARPT